VQAALIAAGATVGAPDRMRDCERVSLAKLARRIAQSIKRIFANTSKNQILFSPREDFGAATDYSSAPRGENRRSLHGAPIRNHGRDGLTGPANDYRLSIDGKPAKAGKYTGVWQNLQPHVFLFA